MTRRVRALLFGGRGQVGNEIIRLGVAGRGGEVDYISIANVDFLRPGDVARSIADAPDVNVVINAAAYTDVNRAESERDLAFRVNSDAVAEMARACAMQRVALIHISTDYVFDGAKAIPYVETDPPNPLNVYGASKLSGERWVRELLDYHVILRTSWVYSAVRTNFVKTMLRLGIERDELKIVADQIGAPTSAADIALTIVKIAKGIVLEPREASYGTFNYTGDGETTWYGFAQKIFAVAGEWAPIKARLVAIGTEDFPTPAKRPLNSRLNCGKILKAWGVDLQPWSASLIPVLSEIKNKCGGGGG